jgi:MoxR-like ATPase
LRKRRLRIMKNATFGEWGIGARTDEERKAEEILRDRRIKRIRKQAAKKTGAELADGIRKLVRAAADRRAREIEATWAR